MLQAFFLFTNDYNGYGMTLFCLFAYKLLRHIKIMSVLHTVCHDISISCLFYIPFIMT
jgi:hypothetical protein